MKKQILLLSALTLMLCLSVSAQSDDTDDLTIPQTDTTLITGKTINIYYDTLNGVVGSSGNGAFGNNNGINGIVSFTFGERNLVPRNTRDAFMVGTDNEVSASHSICLGRNIAVSSAGSFAVGRYLSLSGSAPSFVIGEGLASDAKLSNTATHCLQVGFLSTKPTLTVTSSPNNYSQNVTNKTGKVGIGDVTPTAKLHIKSDNGEDAGIILEPKQPSSNSTYIRLRDSNHKISVAPSGLMQMTAGSQDLKLIGNNISASTVQFDAGTAVDRRLVLSTQPVPAFYCNARRSGSSYSRYVEGPSYALQFGSDGLMVRTAESQNERIDITNWRDALFLGIDSTIVLNGKVGVNTENTTDDYALAVAGGILATEVHILPVNQWPDFVFHDGYALTPLKDLKSYIALNKHLPGFPSETEVNQEGYDVGVVQSGMLQKIEELTLYIIQQEERISQLETELCKLKQHLP